MDTDPAGFTAQDNVFCYPKQSQNQDRGIKINSAGPGSSHSQGYDIYYLIKLFHSAFKFTECWCYLSTKPFIFILTLFLELTRRVFALVLLIMGIGFICIHLHADMVTKAHLYRMRQRCGNLPVGPFKIKI